MSVRVRRIYEKPSKSDGLRVLVDRIWPRGMSKADAKIDEWCKQIAPSTALRKWYGHDPDRFEEFVRRYRAELKESERAEAFKQLQNLAKRRSVTLLTATKNIDISAARVLADRFR